MKKTVSAEKLNNENRAVRSYMIDMIIMLVVNVVIAVYTYGFRAAVSVICSVLAAVATETIGYTVFMKKKPERIVDLSAVFTGLAIALVLPSSAPWWLSVIGSVFAIAVAKLPFGNAVSSPFVPAAVGISFLTVSYPDLFFTYPSLSIGSLNAVTNSENFIAGTSLAQMLSQSKSIGTNILHVLDVFVGRIPGPMGASCLILMVGTLIYMLIRRQSGFVTTLSFIAVCAVMALLFPRVLTGRLYSLLMELSAGYLFFSAVFFISDPVTSPQTLWGRVLYGACAGLLTMIFRYVGFFEEGVCFVIIIMNAVSDVFDRIGISIAKKTKKDNRKQLKRSPNQKAKPRRARNEGGILDHE